MKLIIKLLSASALILGLASCGKKDAPKKTLDPYAPLFVHVKSDNKLRAVSSDTYSPEECMRLIDIMQFKTPKFGDNALHMAVPEEHKNYTNNTIKVYGDFIIDKDGKLVDDFIAGSDFVFISKKGIVGYIPNSVVREAQAKIISAYELENTEEVYRLFKEVFVAHPITDAKYKELKAQGKI